MPIDPTTGAPFPGNKIPSTSFSRLAKTSLAQNIFPAPNCATCGSGINFQKAVDVTTTQNQQTYKLDQDLGRFGKVFGRGTLANYSNTSAGGDRKSTRLNSSHTVISYAVFCLKKKRINTS